MAHPKNAKDQTQYPQIIAAMATSIAATTFVDHPLIVYYKVYRHATGLTAQQKGTAARWYSNKTSLIVYYLLLFTYDLRDRV